MSKENIQKGIYLGKGLLLAYIITIVLILVFSLLMTYSSMKEGSIAILNTIVMVVSIASGSIYVAAKLKENGWINGGILGIGYYFILILLNFVFLKSLHIDLISITQLGINTIIGIIGGIIGINLTS